MFRPQIFLFYLLLIGISVGQINAQKNNFPKYRFDPLTYNVTERAVACIAQDQDGFIWMGTNGLGISRFNGRDYNSY
ncbi:MAG: two-component regulator propeller domain-containing protein, partial [Leeuwenhoekiella sp.]